MIAGDVDVHQLEPKRSLIHRTTLVYAPLRGIVHPGRDESNMTINRQGIGIRAAAMMIASSA